MNTQTDYFATTLRVLMAAAHLTIEDVATITGRPLQFLVAIMNGERSVPSPIYATNTIGRLAEHIASPKVVIE